MARSKWNLIKLVTYAPEEEGALEFEQYLTETGVVGTMGQMQLMRN